MSFVKRLSSQRDWGDKGKEVEQETPAKRGKTVISDTPTAWSSTPSRPDTVVKRKHLSPIKTQGHPKSIPTSTKEEMRKRMMAIIDAPSSQEASEDDVIVLNPKHITKATVTSFSSASTLPREPSHDQSSSHSLVVPQQAQAKQAPSKQGILVAGKSKNAIVLSAEQIKVYDLIVKDRKNVFFTGSAGTGKSVLLQEIIRGVKTREQGPEGSMRATDTVAVTASTGLAACNIGGTTLHSFAGFGLGLEPAEELLKKVRKNKKAATRWLRTKVLVIDEISMVDGTFFDKLNYVAANMRKRPTVPFGGIQIVVTGDFFQLPPVTKKGEPNFCFEAKTWSETIHMTINLIQVFRQKDQKFIDMLNEMRQGTLSRESIHLFKSLDRALPPSTVEPTQLWPLRTNVDQCNQQRNVQLKGDTEVYTAFDSGEWKSEPKGVTILEQMMAPLNISLAIGSQVMMIKNNADDNRLVNGTVGRVTGFLTEEEWRLDTISRLKDRSRSVSVEPNPMNGPTSHTVYGSATVNGKPQAQFKKDQRFPVVEWALPKGMPLTTLVRREQFKYEEGNVVYVMRTQLPLILSWAMSIHKSQGQTLDRVVVDLSRVFEKGQAYVALSRATSLEGLQVIGFDASKVMAHPKVIQWSKSLSQL